MAAVKQPCVYILASQKYGTLYVGVTSDLIARLYQHRSGEVKGFTSRYRVHKLVRFEQLAPSLGLPLSRHAELVSASMVERQCGWWKWILKQVQDDD